MQCAKCEHDLKENKALGGGYTHQNNHFMKPFRVHGYTCPHCGFHNTVFQIPINIPFIRTAKSNSTVEKIVSEFKKQIEEHANRVTAIKEKGFFDEK